MHKELTAYELDRFEQFVQPEGTFLIPPSNSQSGPGWRDEGNSGLLTRLLETAKALLEYDQTNDFGKLPELAYLDMHNLRKFTLEHYEAFLFLIDKYRQENEPV